jgi:hypothetical protein
MEMPRQWAPEDNLYPEYKWAMQDNLDSLSYEVGRHVGKFILYPVLSTTTECIQKANPELGMFECPEEIEKQGKLTALPPMKRQGSVPLQGGVNLTFVNSDTRGPNVYRGYYNTEHPRSEALDNPLQSNPRRPPPHTAFPKISDFLNELDRRYNDPPRSFYKFIYVLTDENQLDFVRINEVVLAANDAGIPGGEWIKTQIENAHSIQGSFNAENFLSTPVHISAGKANLIFQEMKATVSQINANWDNKC